MIEEKFNNNMFNMFIIPIKDFVFVIIVVRMTRKLRNINVESINVLTLLYTK